MVVSYKSQTARLPLLVVNSKGPNLLGRNWLQVIKIDWGEIHNVRVNKNLEELLEKHRVLFQDELGTLKGVFAGVRARDRRVGVIRGASHTHNILQCPSLLRTVAMSIIPFIVQVTRNHDAQKQGDGLV